jgi:hypothetical protein
VRRRAYSCFNVEQQRSVGVAALSKLLRSRREHPLFRIARAMHKYDRAREDLAMSAEQRSHVGSDHSSDVTSGVVLSERVVGAGQDRSSHAIPGVARQRCLRARSVRPI